MTTTKVFARCHLSDEGCGNHKTGRIETTEDSAVNDALAWAEGQIGHPYDCLLVVVYSDETERHEVETYQFESRDGSWLCV